MEMRKVYCSVVEGIVYEQRCLFHLSKVIEGNPVCENCVLRELLRLKRCGGKEAEARPAEKPRPQSKKKPKADRRTSKEKAGDTKESKGSKDIKEINDISRSLDIKDLGRLLGKAKRTIQDLAKKAKIPGARKIGTRWAFDREEVERWLEKGGGAGATVETEEKSKEGVLNEPGLDISERSPEGDPFPPGQDREGPGDVV